MNRHIILALITAVLLGGGVYLYFNSQNKASDSLEHGGGHAVESDTKPRDQSYRGYEIEVTSNNDAVKTQEPTTFTYKIKNDKGEVLKNYEIAHEKIMHFIAVRKDLQYFQHLHPEFVKGTGEFSIDITFPADGPYRVFPDFTPGVENPQKLPVTVYKDVNVGDMSKYKVQPTSVDTQAKKIFDGYQVTHTLPSNLKKQQEVTYSLNIEKNGQPVNNLENYLGALGHSVILKENTFDFIHTHALEDGASRADHGEMKMEVTNKGPEIKFSTTFPDSGIYKIFTQFQHQNKVTTVNYVVWIN